MRGKAGRMFLAGVVSVVAMFSAWRLLRHHSREPDPGYAFEVVGYNDTAAVVLWGGPAGHFVTLSGADGRVRWKQPIEGVPDVQALRVTADAVYVRYSTPVDTNGARWVERIDLDGRVRWKRLIADEGDRIAFNPIEEPLIVGNVLIEPLWADRQHEWHALDTRTGWPLWRIPVGFVPEHIDVNGYQIAIASAGSLTIIDASTGKSASINGIADGCMRGDERLVLRHRSGVDMIVGLPHIDVAKRRIVAMRLTRNDQGRESFLDGCASYGDRTVLMLKRFDGRQFTSGLFEVSKDGSTIAETQLPPVANAYRDEMPTVPTSFEGELPRFTVVALSEGSYDPIASIAVLDLETAALVWREPGHRGSLELERKGTLWFVHEYVENSRADIITVIDGTTGQLVGSRSHRFDFELERVAGETLWVRTSDERHVVTFDARSLTPKGFRAHVLVALFGSEYRSLRRAERAELGR